MIPTIQIPWRAALALGLLAASNVPARGQSTAYLEPAAYAQPAGGALLGVVREAPSGRAPAPWPLPNERRWLFVRGAGRQENIESIEPADPEAGRVMLPCAGTDAHLVGLDLAPRIEPIVPAAFARFLAERGTPIAEPVERAVERALERALERDVERAGREAQETVGVRRVESMKLVVRTEDPGAVRSASVTPMSKSGQRMELRLLVDPTVTASRSALPVRLYVPDGERSGLVAFARHRVSGTARRFELDASGLGHFVPGEAGVWTVEVHQLLALANDPLAAVEWRTATLVFELPAGADTAQRDASDEGGDR